MGTCFNKKKNNLNVGNINVSEGVNYATNQINQQGENIRNEISHPVTQQITQNENVEVESPNDELFKDFENWEGERYKGEGIKRMKGYKTNLKINELSQLRQDFWASKLKSVNKKKWEALKLAAASDHIYSEGILKMHFLQTVEGCLNFCKDSNNVYYKIPNFCINDPYIEKELVVDHHQDKLEKLDIFLYDLYENKKIKVSTNYGALGEDLKNIYIKTQDCPQDKFRIRLLFGGAEILNQHSLQQHKIKEGYTIQVSKSSIVGV